ncbi:ABC transporter ATP-binding protein [Methylobacterium sp. NEAU 140]|uniref:ABC transporter ATP-binding protein n=1 Tax=Methylobacterium sp. NEAU 140 TaxID=3064945 RepID=UPI00273541B1|nr:ABC transporter ATP-binding protein [Methylobacterium sp. NEAU 140]MDP4026492.1 ABC transporter ATP-binding protein [Methylobacterium sp. NEAU 140]
MPASANPSPFLTARKFSARHGRIRVVFNLDFEVYPGEMLAILGANGAGKSSLLGAVAGLVSGDGQLVAGGHEVAGEPAHRRAARGISFVPEQRGNIFGTMSVGENLDVGLRMTKPGRREQVRADILAMFPILEKRMSTASAMLSGGEQQMLAMGMALGREPSLLIMDEPSQGLAPAVFDILQSAFDTLKRRGMAILLAEQNLPFASRIADRYLVLSQGELVATGSKDELGRYDEIMAMFMGRRGPVAA